MPVADNKEAQQAELYRTIWAIATDLRGSVDGWDFKQYVLGMLFYRFISENLTTYLDEGEKAAGNADFSYAKLSDEDAERARDSTVKEKGFFILPSQLFENVRARASEDENLNETLEHTFAAIEGSAVGYDSQDDIAGLFDDFEVNSNKLGSTVIERNKRLAKVLDRIGSLDFGSFKQNKIDAFGDAYEYLMTMYASHAGKSGGEFFTPQEVSDLLARIVIGNKKEVNKVYDPACGSGSLLLKFSKILGQDHVHEGFFGQEINLTTYNLCRINMFLHDINYNHFSIALGDTLTGPKHWDDEPFDCIVSNPPYSKHWAGKTDPLLINDPRFSSAGVLAPPSKADLAFTMHMLSWLSEDGIAAIVEFPGVLYRGGAEKKIREYLVGGNYVDAVIQLPPNLFFGTSIATCVLVLKKSKTDTSILFVDASREFVHEGNKNKLTDGNIKHILNTLNARKDYDHIATLVSNTDIINNDSNLSVSSYVTKEDTREKVDIGELNKKIADIVAREDELRHSIDAIVADLGGDAR
jgi:type I restriction enzyme M protein